MPKWVLLDVSFLCYRALYSMKNLSHDDLPTGVLFGFFSSLRTICEDRRINSNKVVAFADSKTSIREKLFPAYKGKRKEKTPEQQAQQRILWCQRSLLIHEILPSIGVSVYRQKGLESDDLLAMAARAAVVEHNTTAGTDPRAVIVTADGDLFQCINTAVHWFDPARGIYHTPETFKAEKGIEASKWGAVKMLAGCKTDNVPGIGGVGEITAIKMLKRGKPKLDGKKLKILTRNKLLVRLPHPKTRRIVLETPRWNVEAFLSFAREYGMSSFLRDKAGWASFFRGPHGGYVPRKPKVKRAR